MAKRKFIKGSEDQLPSDIQVIRAKQGGFIIRFFDEDWRSEKRQVPLYAGKDKLVVRDPDNAMPFPNSLQAYHGANYFVQDESW